jgi:ribonuclease HI
MVKMIYVHIDEHRKPAWVFRNLRVYHDQSKQELLEMWIAKVRDERFEPWSGIARKMSTRESDYLWFTGNDNDLVTPWYDQETVVVKDPERPSIGPVVTDELDGPSFGPDPPGSGGPTPPRPPGPSPPSASGNQSIMGEDSGSGPAPFHVPHYDGSTTPSKGPVDVKFWCQGKAIVINMQGDVAEDMSQRRVANKMRINLFGYWVASVIEGRGRIGAFQTGDHVELTPATLADLRQATKERTTAEKDPKKKKKKNADTRELKPGTMAVNWSAIQHDRETFVAWCEFAAGLDPGKMVHIITDGGACPNPGSAGWGALLRQSRKYTQTWGHWDMATNNAMELSAVTEALQILPDQMHVWIMTDSAYVKNGITQLVPNRLTNWWKNVSGARVANRSLWERLIAAVHRVRRVEWSWVKGHNGRLLNECTYMLATQGVFNEQRQSSVARVRVVKEDTEHTE